MPSGGGVRSLAGQYPGALQKAGRRRGPSTEGASAAPAGGPLSQLITSS